MMPWDPDPMPAVSCILVRPVPWDAPAWATVPGDIDLARTAAYHRCACWAVRDRRANRTPRDADASGERET